MDDGVIMALAAVVIFAGGTMFGAIKTYLEMVGSCA